ncbi:PrgI family protein [Ruminococcus sp.]
MQENFVHIPKDLSLIKQKFIFGLTKRQVIGFAVGLGCGLPIFFIVKAIINNLTIAIFAMGIFAIPGIMYALFSKNGMFFETYVAQLIKFFKKPRIRKYEPLTSLKAIENQIEYNRLKRILFNAGVDIPAFDNKKKVTLFEKIANRSKI